MGALGAGFGGIGGRGDRIWGLGSRGALGAGFGGTGGAGAEGRGGGMQGTGLGGCRGWGQGATRNSIWGHRGRRGQVTFTSPPLSLAGGELGSAGNVAGIHPDHGGGAHGALGGGPGDSDLTVPIAAHVLPPPQMKVPTDLALLPGHLFQLSEALREEWDRRATPRSPATRSPPATPGAPKPPLSP